METYREMFILRNNIKELRKARGWTQSELGRRCGIPQGTISAYENEAYYPTAYHSGLICQALGKTWFEVFWYQEKY